MKSEVFNGSRFWTYFKYDFTQMWRNHVKASILIGFSGLILYILGIAFNAVFRNVWEAPTFVARTIVFMLAVFALELYQTRTYGYLTNRKKGAAWQECRNDNKAFKYYGVYRSRTPGTDDPAAYPDPAGFPPGIRRVCGIRIPPGNHGR